MNLPSLKFCMLRSVLTLCIVFFTVTLTHANDGEYYTSGNQLLPLVETDIRVQREILTLRWSDDNVAEVDVYYEFYNPGKPKTVLMGFEADPPMYIDSISRNSAHPNISDFKVMMNGRSIPVSTTVVETDTLYVVNGEVQPVDLSVYSINDDYNIGSYLFTADRNDAVPISYVYHFNADFKSGINVVRHRYRYEMNVNVCTHYLFDYKLSPALRWANHQIDDFTLRIETEDVPLHFMMKDSLFEKSVSPVIDGTGKWRIRTIINEMDRKMSVYEVFMRNASIEWKATNFRPSSELHIFSADCTETGVICNPAEYYSWRYSLVSGSIHYDDIHRIVRNMPYAYRGYIFKNKYLNDFFTSRWWYIPDPDYKVDLEKLTPNERDWLKKYNEDYGK